MRKKQVSYVSGLPVLFFILLVLEGCQKSTTNASDNPPNNVVTPTTKKWVVTTLAGSGTAGFADGDSTQAQFSNVQGITIDNQGNLFVGDVGNTSIRKITPAGHVTTYAGRNIGNPNPAFGNIYGMVADKQGNLYTIEYGLIRKLLADTSFIFAGGLSVNYLDSNGTNAAFNIIGNMTMDQYGTIYLPDYDMNNNIHVRKVTNSGVVSTLSLNDNTGFPSNGLPNSHYYYAIANDPSGNLYLSANGNALIKKIDPQGNVTVFAGAGSLALVDGKGSLAFFNTILGMTCDASGNLWVADSDNHAIRKVTPDGTVTTIAGNGTPGFADGDSTQALFRYPFGIAVGSNSVVYVVDNGNNRIRKLEYK